MIDLQPAGDQDISRRDHQAQYLEFLDDENDEGIYADAVKQMMKHGEQRLTVNVNDLRRKFPARARALFINSVEEIVLFQNALKEFISHRDPTLAALYDEFLIGFEGSFGTKHVTPRNLSSEHLGSIIAVEGIVTKCSLVRPKISRSVHYCPKTGKKHERKYTDVTSLSSGLPTSAVYPTADEEGNRLETEYGLSTYTDHQTLSIQEMPEKAPAGQLPRSVDIIADNDLVDKCKPGDRVLVVGPYRCLPAKQGAYTSGTFRTVVLASNVNLLSKEDTPDILEDDLRRCKDFSKRKDVFETLARSLAPSIYGYEYIKKALLCMLLGGMEKVLPNGTRLRGDINILLIGDPSVSKSQLLRYVLNCAPRAVATTGRGSSGVGLTAAVTTDGETGDRRLEAGAMVLADRGVVCIDEFDKMSDIDRTAIHEVMEQGRVTITKAGIQAKLNARCSVLAAANPVYGRYDQYKTPMENIGLQDSLLSRFDLLFIMLDTNNVDNDSEISDHVVRMHRYRAANEQDGDPLPIISSADFLSTKNPNKMEIEEQTDIYEKYDPLLHGKRKRREKIVSIDFMKKYIHIAKKIKPQLTKEACDIIAQEYAKLRNYDLEQNDVARTQPITARTLETLIRLATAHARARFSKSIDPVDAKSAVEMIQFSHFKKVLERPRKRRRNAETGEEESDYEDMEEEETEEVLPTKRRSQPEEQEESVQEGDVPMEQEEEVAPAAPVLRTTIEKVVDLDAARLKDFRSHLFRVFQQKMSSSILLETVFELMAAEGFSRDEIQSGLVIMQDKNQVFVSGDTVIMV